MTLEQQLDENTGCRAKAGERLRRAPTARDLRQASGEAVEHDRVTSRRLARVREEEDRRRATAPAAKWS